MLNLTKSNTIVAAGVLLVFGGISRTAETGLDCCEWFGMFLMNVNLWDIIKTQCFSNQLKQGKSNSAVINIHKTYGLNTSSFSSSSERGPEELYPNTHCSGLNTAPWLDRSSIKQNTFLDLCTFWNSTQPKIRSETAHVKCHFRCVFLLVGEKKKSVWVVIWKI